MADPKELTRTEILRTADNFKWTKKMPKWRVIVNSRELPARPLVLEAARVAPNDPTNSHQAVAILEKLGFETRYVRENLQLAASRQHAKTAASQTQSLASTFLDIAQAASDSDWAKVPSDLSKNLDEYLYGKKKVSK